MPGAHSHTFGEGVVGIRHDAGGGGTHRLLFAHGQLNLTAHLYHMAKRTRGQGFHLQSGCFGLLFGKMDFITMLVCMFFFFVFVFVGVSGAIGEQ